MKLRDYSEYFLVKGLFGLCRILPEAWVYAVFRGLGRLGHALLAGRRKLALHNTEIAFPNKGLDERKHIVQQHFINLAESMAFNSLVQSGRISNERILTMVNTDEWDVFQRYASEAPNGLLLISGHLGNWELLPQYLALRLKQKLHVITRKIDNQLLEEKLVRPLRERFGVNVFYKKNAMANLVRVARKHDVAGLLIDQKLGKKQGIPIDFFGRTAVTTATPAILQIRFNLTVIPLFMVKVERHRYRLIIDEPVNWTDNGQPMEEQVAELTRIHQKMIEDMIREYPEQWFWVHDRWKTKKRVS